jgi:predicted ArsR family transcriptional regulator
MEDKFDARFTEVFDRLERIERLLTERRDRVTPPELSRREAARYLGVSIDTLIELQAAGLVRYRNASPPGSGKPRYRYPVADLDSLMRQGYRRDPPRAAKAPSRRQKRPRPQTYEHLDLE